MALIEILPGIYYDTEKAWYEQEGELIELANNTMQNQQPKSTDFETENDHNRLIWGVWESTTETGTFDMRVDMFYEFPISHKAFLSKSQHDTVTITQIA